MREIKPEQPTELLTQIANCNDVLAHMPADGEADPAWLDIDLFISSCGTYRCWLGDYSIRRIGELFYGSAREYAADEFGWCIYDAVFAEHAGATADRKAALAAHVAALQDKVDAWYAQIYVGEVVV